MLLGFFEGSGCRTGGGGESASSNCDRMAFIELSVDWLVPPAWPASPPPILPPRPCRGLKLGGGGELVRSQGPSSVLRCRRLALQRRAATRRSFGEASNESAARQDSGKDGQPERFDDEAVGFGAGAGAGAGAAWGLHSSESGGLLVPLWLGERRRSTGARRRRELAASAAQHPSALLRL